MNCAISHEQQYETQQQHQQSTSITATIRTVVTTTVTATSSVPTTTSSREENFLIDSGQENVTLMIKNIVETSSNRTEWDQKEEKNENCSFLNRRESVPEDSSEVDNTVQQNFEISNNFLSPTPVLKLFENDPQTTPTIEEEKEEGVVLIILENSSSSVVPQAEQQQQNEQVEKQQSQQEEQQNASIIEYSSCDSTSLNRSADNTSSSNNSLRHNRTPSPCRCQRSDSATSLKLLQKTPSNAKLTNDPIQSSNLSANYSRTDDDSISKSSDTSGELVRGILSQDNIGEKCKSANRLSERAKRKSWFNVLVPNYKSRCQEFKKLFKEVPSDERLIVDYSCAWQRDILVQGRLYVSQNYVCFHANIFRWETYLSIKWKDVTAITKEKTALVIPNAISICTEKEKYFFATFATRDKTFLMLFRVWQNTLMNKQMLPQEMWQWVHNCYGDELGLTSEDEDYIDPSCVTKETQTEAEEEDSEDLEFVSATDDAISQLEREIDVDVEALVKESIAGSYNSDEALKQFSRTGILSLTNSTTCLGNNIANITKSIRKTHSSSSTTTTSGSDNKTSDNNSSNADSKTNQKSQHYNNHSNNNNNNVIMKSNVKELLLTSAKLSSADEGGSGSGGPGSATYSGINGDGGCGGISGLGGGTGSENKSASIGYDGKRKVSKNNRQRDESLNKNAEGLPTDMSDSSDSDENKIPFVATAECNSTHEGRQLMHTILPINVDTLFNLLFSKSKFLTDFHVMRKSSDTNFGEWERNEDGQQTRTVNLTVALSASVGPKASKVTEHQVMRDCSKTGELYSIDINTVNAGIPYADSFSVMLHYCFVRTVDDHTMLSVHAQIKYKKSIWGVVKGLIEKNTWAGLEDFYTSLLHALQSETNIPPAKGKGRRPRRGTAVLVRPPEETMPALQMKPDTAIEKVLTPNTFRTPQLVTTNNVIPGENTNKYKLLSVFVIVLLILLILLNVILLLKLWKLEVRIDSEYSNRPRIPNLTTMKELPNTPQDWIQVVRDQEILHEAELKKWHKVLQTAIELLKKTEKGLAELMFR